MPDHKSPILTATNYYLGKLNRVVINGNHLNSQTKWCIEHLCKVDLVQTGSSLKLCKPTCGCEDLRPKLAPTCEWNNSPAQAIMDRAARGVFELNGNRFAYGNQSKLNPSSVETANKDLQAKALPNWDSIVFDFAYIVAGALTGFVIGVTGVGGGAIMTPCLASITLTAALTRLFCY